MEYKELFEETRKEFLNAVKRCSQTQKEVLYEIIKSNTESEYGIRYNFKKIKTVEEYRKMVPITEYEDYEEYIEKIKKGEKKILTTEDIILLEPTSGSSTKSKLIPYTKSLKTGFNKGIKPWLSDLF